MIVGAGLLPSLVAAVLGVLAAGPVGARWLRVAQREHYLPSWVSRFAGLWLARSPATALLAALAVVLIVLALVPGWLGWAAEPAVVVLALLPIGLGVRGTSAKFAFTSRMRRLIVAWVVVLIVAVGLLGLLLGGAGIALALLLAAPLTDLSLLIMAPIEARVSRRFVVEARNRLRQSGARVIAITGSYGKTSTKGYTAHLMSGAYSVVASPASFNNLMGLSRSINERLSPGTEFFIAEMGTYGEGEIRELAGQFPPDIAAITTIGEAHLQRMRRREVIVRAKSEIVERARAVVLPIDEPELAELAEHCRAAGKQVTTVSARAGEAQVVVDPERSEVRIADADGTLHRAPFQLPVAGHAVNLAVAVGIALAAGTPVDAILARLGGLPVAHHRAEVQRTDHGVLIVDDTYNSNTIGASAAADAAARLAAEPGSALRVVSPGMVELGPVQAERNRAFAAHVAGLGGTLYAVGRTNRAALLAGAGPAASAFRTRQDAAAAALRAAGPDDVMLYENDLPDHYP